MKMLTSASEKEPLFQENHVVTSSLVGKIIRGLFEIL